MKKKLGVLCVIGLISALVVSGCAPAAPQQTPESASPTPIAATAAPTAEPTAIPNTPTIEPTAAPTPESIEQTIVSRASQVLEAIKNKNYASLSQAAHPEKGVRFTPYATVQDSDIVLSAAQIANLATDTKSLHWGDYDGSGEPIDVSFADYYKKFVYDVDFINAPQISYNQTLGTGNSINNIAQYYSGAAVVEYHFDGFDEQYGGMDWKSLRLVFENPNGTWYLVGIVHDQWTI